MEISARDNPKIKNYCKLAANRRYRHEMGEFVLEGARICIDCAKQSADNPKINIVNIFVTHEAVDKYLDGNAEIFENVGDFYYISKQVAEKMRQTDNSQEIFMQVKIPKADDFSGNSKVCILDNLQDPGNVGTILRTCDALGINSVFLCSCCDLYNPKTIRATMGSIFHLDIYDGYSFEQTVQIMRKNNITVYGSVLDNTAKSLDSIKFAGKSAAVIGNEGKGMPEEDINLCDEKITIKMKGCLDSLNASMAAGIILWEMNK